MNQIILTDNLPWLEQCESESVDLIYIDPPFNTGQTQTMQRIKAVRDKDGTREGFGGHRYNTLDLGKMSFADAFGNLQEFLYPRLVEAYRILKPTGSIFFHIDYREVHYCKVILDVIFGRDCFINEIIWSYDFGGRSKKKWSSKHDNILWYAKDPKNYTFNYDAIDRIPYLAPGLVGPKKAALGKTPTSCWWHTIVPTNGKERTGYPTQKPLGIIRRIVAVHSNAGDQLLDFFAGSGTLGYAAAELGRDCILVDSNPEAVAVMQKRFSAFSFELRLSE